MQAAADETTPSQRFGMSRWVVIRWSRCVLVSRQSVRKRIKQYFLILGVMMPFFGLGLFHHLQCTYYRTPRASDPAPAQLCFLPN